MHIQCCTTINAKTGCKEHKAFSAFLSALMHFWTRPTIFSIQLQKKLAVWTTTFLQTLLDSSSQTKTPGREMALACVRCGGDFS